ncbi:MAG: hypothetical protein OEZ22_02660 [Spirochaetia bacterium]|nr:hypothetical protein [Spirochaetia bacterium]
MPSTSRDTFNEGTENEIKAYKAEILYNNNTITIYFKDIAGLVEITELNPWETSAIGGLKQNSIAGLLKTINETSGLNSITLSSAWRDYGNVDSHPSGRFFDINYLNETRMNNGTGGDLNATLNPSMPAIFSSFFDEHQEYSDLQILSPWKSKYTDPNDGLEYIWDWGNYDCSEISSDIFSPEYLNCMTQMDKAWDYDVDHFNHIHAGWD